VGKIAIHLQPPVCG